MCQLLCFDTPSLLIINQVSDYLNLRSILIIYGAISNLLPLFNANFKRLLHSGVLNQVGVTFDFGLFDRGEIHLIIPCAVFAE